MSHSFCICKCRTDTYMYISKRNVAAVSATQQWQAQLHQNLHLVSDHASRLHLPNPPLSPPFPGPSSLTSSVSSASAGAYVYQCAFCCECENICKCAARLANEGTAWHPSRADTGEVVNTAQPLAAGEVAFIKSCQRLEIRSAIYNPVCVSVSVFTWVRDETWSRNGGSFFPVFSCLYSSRVGWLSTRLPVPASCIFSQIYLLQGINIPTLLPPSSFRVHIPEVAKVSGCSLTRVS